MSKNVFTLEAFAEFCESKPGGETYNYLDPGKCACGQYARSLGVKNWMEIRGSFWKWADLLAFRANSRTFGDLAALLRSADQ